MTPVFLQNLQKFSETNENYKLIITQYYLKDHQYIIINTEDLFYLTHNTFRPTSAIITGIPM
jgi:hypothetical protein